MFIFFMAFIASILQKLADFVFVSLKLNQVRKTSVGTTIRLSECKVVRKIACAPIGLSVFHCFFCVSVCFCVGTWMDVIMCI